ncbi:hypothetical protein NLI96_g12146 [Meripilus lineatus]|uniref:Uncharacterized protein n=1 Tax=Meripilus lineatus TaxID=2056292 RepID=A0AAD5UVC4_9APHY|nr:hypothetical protein NLI96_g12146 [Physisporinus lineatus]
MDERASLGRLNPTSAKYREQVKNQRFHTGKTLVPRFKQTALIQGAMSPIPTTPRVDTESDYEDMPPLEGDISETNAENCPSLQADAAGQPILVHEYRMRGSKLSHRQMATSSHRDHAGLGTYKKVSGDSITVILSSKFASNSDEEAKGKPREPLVIITEFEGGAIIHISPPIERGSPRRGYTSEDISNGSEKNVCKKCSCVG